eukprot:COSAG01_NODE_6429_length_3670_cov_6.618594_2_plen_67_part_00
MARPAQAAYASLEHAWLLDNPGAGGSHNLAAPAAATTTAAAAAAATTSTAASLTTLARLGIVAGGR